MRSILKHVKQQLIRWCLACWSPAADSSEAATTSSSTSSSFSSASAFQIIDPWMTLLSTTASDDLVERGVMPVLARSIVDVLDVADAPRGSDLLRVELGRWHSILGTVRTSALLSAHFFPRWLRHLRTWLSESLRSRRVQWESQVLAWYETWSSSLPAEIKNHPMIKSHVMLALSMLNAASEHGGGDDSLLPKVPDVATTFARKTTSARNL